jgi:hypothetical protein
MIEMTLDSSTKDVGFPVIFFSGNSMMTFVIGFSSRRVHR